MENTNIALKIAQTSEDFDKVQRSLEMYLPESYMIYGYLVARKTYKARDKDAEKKILFSPQSTLVVVTWGISEKGVQSLSVFWNVFQDDEYLITNQLKSISDIEWKQPVFFYATPLVLIEKLQTLALKGILGDGYLTPQRLFLGYLYSLTSQPELEPRLPEGFELRRLREEHGKIMHDHWDYNIMETLDSYKDCVRVFPGVGVFRTSDRCNDFVNNQANNEDQRSQGGEDLSQGGNLFDSPVAWSHISPFNVHRNTYTLPEYRGQKLALAVTLALAKTSIQETGFAAACIADNNYASIKLHERAGFTRQYTLGYQYFKSSLGTSSFEGLEPLA